MVHSLLNNFLPMLDTAKTSLKMKRTGKNT